MTTKRDGSVQSHSAGAHFELQPRGPYSLNASMRFLEGFTPAARTPTTNTQHLHMAFVPDGGAEAVGVCVREEDGVIVGEVWGDAPVAQIRDEVARILSLDVDGAIFPAVGERDAVVGALQRRYPDLRPVCFYTPYEAAAWALIGNRIRIPQAARIKARMAEEYGVRFDIHDDAQYAFPVPDRLVDITSFDGLNERKLSYLHGLTPAVAAGTLHAATLRALPQAEAIERLKTIKGIGDFGAELILLRGAGTPDSIATHEPRLVRAVQHAYNLDEPPSPEQLAQIADGWRPFRTWVTFLLRVALEEETKLP